MAIARGKSWCRVPRGTTVHAKAPYSISPVLRTMEN